VLSLASPIVIDGILSEPAWRDATRVDTWYETSPGDNTPPAVRSVGYVGFDDSAFYAAFEFFDPNPRSIRAPLGDHDHINGSTTDYGGVILDTRNDGHSAVLLLASATGIQYDAITDDDGSGEDSSPDFFWQAAAKINDRGWTLELRVPFSTPRRFRPTSASRSRIRKSVPIFLEGVEMFSTPVKAVYTRAVTAPEWGARDR
jgi:hypothetical protein